MIANDFKILVSLSGRLDQEAASHEFIACMKQLHLKLQADLSASSLLLYQELHRRAALELPDIVLPSFYDDEFLDRSFESDPSDYAVAFGLAMKNLYCGNHPRAIQLLTRIANSEYRESRLARHKLDELESLPPALRHG